MSYEGYSQCICKEGHYSTKDCYDNSKVCIICQAPIVWDNMVDKTNGEEYGFISPSDLDKFKVTREAICTCECGHKHVRIPAFYLPPTDKETQAMRTINYGDGPKYVKDLTDS